MPYEPSNRDVYLEMIKKPSRFLSNSIRNVVTTSIHHLSELRNQLYHTPVSLDRTVRNVSKSLNKQNIEKALYSAGKTIYWIPRGVIDFHLFPGRYVAYFASRPKETSQEGSKEFTPIPEEEVLGRITGITGAFLGYTLNAVFREADFETLLPVVVPLLTNLASGTAFYYKLTKEGLRRHQRNSNHGQTNTSLS